MILRHSSGVVFQSLYLRQGPLLLAAVRIHQASWPVISWFCVGLPFHGRGTGITGMHYWFWLSVESQNLNSGPHTCVANPTLLSHLQGPTFFMF